MRFPLAAAALLLTATALPASAQSLSGSGGGVSAVPPGAQPAFGRDFGFDRDRRDVRRRGRVDTTVVLPFGYYDDRFAERQWAPNSYNDWWHERPERSYPRWMQNNRNCERMWWSGGGWTC